MDTGLVDTIVRLLNEVGAPAVYLAGLIVLWRRVNEHTKTLEMIVEKCIEELSEDREERKSA